MSGKGICPVCGQLVNCGSIIFADDRNVIVDDSPSRSVRPKLTLRHPAVAGYAHTAIVSQQTGEVIETMCDGSLRPVKEVVMH